LNLVLAPVELLCIPLFYRVGAWSLGSDPIPFSAKEMVEQLRKVRVQFLSYALVVLFLFGSKWQCVCFPSSKLLDTCFFLVRNGSACVCPLPRCSILFVSFGAQWQ
jgi:hypothetical protein